MPQCSAVPAILVRIRPLDDSSDTSLRAISSHSTATLGNQLELQQIFVGKVVTHSIVGTWTGCKVGCGTVAALRVEEGSRCKSGVVPPL